MSEVYGIDHVQLSIPAAEEERARAFYAGLLGFSEVPKPEALAGRGARGLSPAGRGSTWG